MTGTAPDAPARSLAAPVSRLRRHRRARFVVVCGCLALAAAAAFLFSLSTGTAPIPLPDVLRSLAGHGERSVDFVIYDLRLPRGIVGVLVGVALGTSGAIFQRLVRNPLASPDIVGITWGASAGAVIAIVVFGAAGPTVSVGSLGGAIGTGLLIYGIAWNQGISGYRLVLVGVGLGALLASVVSYLLTVSDVDVAQDAFIWLTGSLNGRSWSQVWPLLIGIATLLPCALLQSRALSVLELGDETAASLGLPVERTRLSLVFLGVALTAMATAAAGPVAFVALVAGPIAAGLTSGGVPGLIPSALVGALIMQVSDYTGQHLHPTIEYPVGAITGIVGAPYLVWLLVRANRRSSTA